ncbi:hypothetical protein [Kutzneria chonburiensis]|uniref:Glycosyltransferase RgtA/B/C/D-like domain-containing protein n=1 Tax=Kutzneria chonburiensis TaxID=1483604 RepID=A0ABV6MN46_9PSEU|nr:hypothetical protein [Kutzneria chonburiensis]
MIFLFVQILVAPSSTLFPDSNQYSIIAYRFLGDSEQTAVEKTVGQWCADQARHQAQANDARMVPDRAFDPARSRRSCVADNTDNVEFTGQPRYHQIFTPRIGYPLAVAALVPLAGMRIALWAVPVGCTLLAGILLWYLLIAVGLRSSVAAVGQALLYVLPTGTWGVLSLSEGPALLGVVAAMLGSVLLSTGRRRSGIATLIAGLVVAGLVKYSTALPFAGVLVVVALVGLWRRAGDRRGLLFLGVTGAAVTGAVVLVSSLLRLPGMAESLQDSFTDHFHQPDVPDPFARLLEVNGRYWLQWLTFTPMNVTLLAGSVVGGWAMWRRDRFVALLVLACGALGFALTAAHPEVTQGDRLYVLAWLIPVVGLPIAVQRLVDSARTTVLDVVVPADSPLTCR